MEFPWFIPISCNEYLPVTESPLGRSITIVSANKMKLTFSHGAPVAHRQVSNILKRTEVHKIKSKFQTQQQQLWLGGWFNALLLL